LVNDTFLEWKLFGVNESKLFVDYGFRIAGSYSI